MKKRFQRVVSSMLVVLLTFHFFALPVSATGEVTAAGNWWSYLFNENSNSDNYLKQTVGAVVGLLSSDACLLNDDGKHRGYVKKKKVANEPTDKTWIATCSSCGADFEVLEDAFKENYNAYTNKQKEETGINNISMDGTSKLYLTGWTYDAPHADGKKISTKAEYPHYVGKGGNYNNESIYRLGTWSFRSGNFKVPVTGNYKVVIPPPIAEVSIVREDKLFDFTFTVYDENSFLKQVAFSELEKIQEFMDNGSIFSIGLESNKLHYIASTFYIFVPDDINIYSFSFERPYIEGVKLFTDTAPEIKTNETRAGSMSGNFGQMIDGQVTRIENSGNTNNIVNEGNKTYYNPITNTTSNITDWNYDYSDRSYHLTTKEGDTVTNTTVTYGDENITIKEGDTIYNIYYMYPENSGGGGTDPDPPTSCTHAYAEEITTVAGCLSDGLKTFTCSKCSKTYTEKIPAIGHTWVLDRTINTTYDESGTVLVQGYTIYKCSSCSNEYKDTEGKGPPSEVGGGGGNFFTWLFEKLGELLGAVGEGLMYFIQNVLGKILDALITLVKMLVEKLQVLLDALFKIFDAVPQMFTGFTEFLNKVFTFVPPEIITIITFGIIAVVLIAILKALKG